MEDALVVAMQLNAFVRHAHMVKMANIAQIVNVIAPIVTRHDGLFLQTIFYAFETYSALAGPTALDVHWDGDTFSAGDHASVRVLDVTATLDPARKELVLFVVNRSEHAATDAVLTLTGGKFAGSTTIRTVNGPHAKSSNSFDDPDQVTARVTSTEAAGTSLSTTFEPHSLTALVCAVE